MRPFVASACFKGAITAVFSLERSLTGSRAFGGCSMAGEAFPRWQSASFRILLQQGGLAGFSPGFRDSLRRPRARSLSSCSLLDILPNHRRTSPSTTSYCSSSSCSCLLSLFRGRTSCRCSPAASPPPSAASGCAHRAFGGALRFLQFSSELSLPLLWRSVEEFDAFPPRSCCFFCPFCFFSSAEFLSLS